jgi:hypothetical protein
MMRRFCIALIAMVATSSLSLSQSIGEGNGGSIGSFDFQSMELFQPPTEGIVTPLDDNSGFLYVGSATAMDSLSIIATDDYGSTLIEVEVDAVSGVASYRSTGTGPKAISASFVENQNGEGLVAMAVYVNRPLASSSNPADVDFPCPDQTGRCHDDLPDFVPETWPIGVLEDALEAIEESIRQRLRDITSPTADPLQEPSHRERLRREEKSARKLRNRISQVSRIGAGATMADIGARMVAIEATSSAVILADDATVIGVVDDPLLVVTGGVAVVGGGLLIVSGIIDWWYY